MIHGPNVMKRHGPFLVRRRHLAPLSIFPPLCLWPSRVVPADRWWLFHWVHVSLSVSLLPQPVDICHIWLLTFAKLTLRLILLPSTAKVMDLSLTLSLSHCCSLFLPHSLLVFLMVCSFFSLSHSFFLSVSESTEVLEGLTYYDGDVPTCGAIYFVMSF